MAKPIQYCKVKKNNNKKNFFNIHKKNKKQKLTNHKEKKEVNKNKMYSKHQIYLYRNTSE